MSCYFRHLNQVLIEAGIQVSPANRKQIDRAIHEFVGAGYKDCPAIWKRLKTTVLADDTKRRELVTWLKRSVS